jgi:molecular chaperone GrpE
MTEPKGPKVDIPDELVEELEETDTERTPATPAGTAEEAADNGAAERALRAELERLNDKYLRLAAEFENTRRRYLKEHQDLLNYANENLIKQLLDTVDNLERALGHASDAEEGVDKENLREGVALTHRSLMSALERQGVEVIDARGEVFDPRRHEALQSMPSADQAPGTVLEVFKKGYLLKGRLLRPAQVIVAGPPKDS